MSDLPKAPKDRTCTIPRRCMEREEDRKFYETEEEREDKQYWTDLNKTLDRYIKKHKVPELMSAKLFRLDSCAASMLY